MGININIHEDIFEIKENQISVDKVVIVYPT